MQKFCFSSFTFLIFFLSTALSFQASGQGAPFLKTPGGVRYIIHSAIPNAPKPVPGDVVELSMVYTNSADSVLFDNSKGEYDFSYTIEKPVYPGDFNEALSLLGVGDSATFKLKADSFYLKTIGEKKLPLYIRKGSDLTFRVKVLSYTPQQEFMKKQLAMIKEQSSRNDSLRQQDADKLKKYLEARKISVSPTVSGLYVIIENEGNGDLPVTGNKVVINYNGKFLNGKTFDSSYEMGIPLEFKVGGHSVIKGLDEGVRLMKKGSKATLIIPSYLAYGEHTAGEIPPFTSLIFEVELIDIK